MSDGFSTVANNADEDDDGEDLIAEVDVTQADVVDTAALAAKKKPTATRNDDGDDDDWWFISIAVQK